MRSIDPKPSELLDKPERRWPAAPFYCEPGSRGGSPVRPWNPVVRENLVPAPAEAT